MENQKPWTNFLCAKHMPLIWGICIAFALMIAAPAIADGTTAHEHAPPTLSEDTDPGNPGISKEEPKTELKAADLPQGQDHAHDNGDDHGETVMDTTHDHSTHGPNEALLKTGAGRLLVWLGKFHPAAVHFPIALLLGAALAELLSIRFANGLFRDAARFCLWLGTLGAVGAATLGWLYGGFRLVDEDTVLALHRWNGTGIAILATLSLWLGETQTRRKPSRKGAHRTMLFVTAVLVSLNGYWGGLMVHGPEQHQWPAEPVEHAD